MKNRILTALGVGAGTIIYELIKHGPAETDWMRGGFVAAISLMIFLLLPRRWFEPEISAK